MDSLVSKWDSYSVDFHNGIGLKAKPAGDIFQIFFIYIYIISIYIYKEFFENYFGVQGNYEFKKLKGYISYGHNSNILIQS